MKNLMKYEIIRMKSWLLLALGAIGILEVGVLLSMLAGQETPMFLCTFGLAMTFWFLVVGIAVAILVQYSRDVNRKSGYMLFMTPNSYYKIIGSKILTSMFLIIGLILFGVLLAVADGLVAAARFNELVELNFFGLIRDLGIHFEPRYAVRGIVWLTYGFFGWVSIFTPIFFVMTLNRACFSDWKCRGLISFVLFLILTGVFSVIENRLVDLTAGSFSGAKMLVEFIMTVCMAVGCYIGTVKILEKRIAL